MEKAKAGQYLTFKVQETTFGVAIESVREINQMIDIVALPKTPANVKGVINLRGKIIPVVTLAETVKTKNSCIVVMDSGSQQVGLIVDKVEEVIYLKEEDLDYPISLQNQENKKLVQGLGKYKNEVVVLLKIDEAFSLPQVA